MTEQIDKSSGMEINSSPNPDSQDVHFIDKVQSTLTPELPNRPKGLNKLAVTAGGLALAGAAAAAGIFGMRATQSGGGSVDGDNGGSTLVDITPTPSPTEVSEPEPEPIRVEKEVFEYFKEIGLKFEDAGGTTLLKWMEDPIIEIHGNPNATDLERVKKIVEDINSIQDGIKIRIAQEGEDGTLDVHIDSIENFKKIKPSAPRVTGYAAIISEPVDEKKDPLFVRKIVGGTVLVATELTQENRNSILLEEITQALGLPNDADIYPDSIFRDSPPNVQEYSQIDKKIIKFLYDKRVKPGMLEDDLLKIVEFIE